MLVFLKVHDQYGQRVVEEKDDGDNEEVVWYDNARPIGKDAESTARIQRIIYALNKRLDWYKLNNANN